MQNFNSINLQLSVGDNIGSDESNSLSSSRDKRENSSKSMWETGAGRRQCRGGKLAQPQTLHFPISLQEEPLLKKHRWKQSCVNAEVLAVQQAAGNVRGCRCCGLILTTSFCSRLSDRHVFFTLTDLTESDQKVLSSKWQLNLHLVCLCANFRRTKHEGDTLIGPF